MLAILEQSRQFLGFLSNTWCESERWFSSCIQGVFSSLQVCGPDTVDRNVVTHLKRSMAWLTYSICSHSAERCLFKDMVGLKNTQRREHEPGLFLVMVKCKMKWNNTTSFDSPQELNPQLWIQSMSFKCSQKTTANSCLCMKVSFDSRALRSVWEECPQSTRGCMVLDGKARVCRQVCFSEGEVNFCGLDMRWVCFVLFK